MLIKSQTEYKLKSPPEDAISSVKFGPNTNQFLLVSSWDGYVRLYDVIANSLRHKYSHNSPVLDCCFTVNIIELLFQNTVVFIILGCSTLLQWRIRQYIKIIRF